MAASAASALEGREGGKHDIFYSVKIRRVWVEK